MMPATTEDTREAIMKTGRAMVQARGYSSLSFREIAKAVGVKSASIHYHFPTKGNLGAALARRYAEDAGMLFAAIADRATDLTSALKAYTDIFRAALLDENRMCLCGIMAAEHDDLPAEVRAEVMHFNDVNIAWLAETLARHKAPGDAAARNERALAIFAAIEGAQLLARGRGDVGIFDRALGAYRTAGLLA